MPIEVRELVIQATIDSSSSTDEGGSEGVGSKEVKQIQASVDQVMAMIKNKNER